jgi:nicotinic acetylcholine receptor
MQLSIAFVFMHILLCASASNDEFRLLKYLREGYDVFERPVENSSQALNVSVRVYLQQILDVVSCSHL